MFLPLGKRTEICLTGVRLFIQQTFTDIHKPSLKALRWERLILDDAVRGTCRVTCQHEAGAAGGGVPRALQGGSVCGVE